MIQGQDARATIYGKMPVPRGGILRETAGDGKWLCGRSVRLPILLKNGFFLDFRRGGGAIVVIDSKGLYIGILLEGCVAEGCDERLKGATVFLGPVLITCGSPAYERTQETDEMMFNIKTGRAISCLTVYLVHFGIHCS